MRRELVKSVVYSFVVADLFHYGHLQLLMTAKSLGDLHICGVLTDEAAAAYRPHPISNFEERVGVISSIKYVDRVMIQSSKDPTENLMRVHEEFPSARLILVHGDDWEHVPGRQYVKSIGGEVVQPGYYRRLSDAVIRREMASQAQSNRLHYEFFTEHFRIGDLVVFDDRRKHVVMSTKANTLRSLRPYLKNSRIEKMFVFRVDDWRCDPDHVLQAIREQFGSEQLVVRSSALNEDTYYNSQAGRYRSESNVPANESQELKSAVERVIGSYEERGNLETLNQVFVQVQLTDVRASGVVVTCRTDTAAPYYRINYEEASGRTDGVTGGRESNLIEIWHTCPLKRCPPQWRKLLGAVREIEQIIPNTPLDIEFAIDRDGEVVIFQVRPLACRRPLQVHGDVLSRHIQQMRLQCRRLLRPKAHLAGSTSCFSDMAFWNPAEIIGDRPNALARSLYRYLVMDGVWHQALTPLGYTDVAPAPLMVEFGGKPYVDVRAVCNALIPADVSDSLREKLVKDHLRTLRDRPEVHDKVEFEVIDNCFDFTLAHKIEEMGRAGLSNRERETYVVALKRLTIQILLMAPTLYQQAFEQCRRMQEKRDSVKRGADEDGAVAGLVRRAMTLLNDCRTYGTLSFSQMARLAFIGRRLLQSLLDGGYIDRGLYDRFLDHIRTVATRMEEDFRRLNTGQLSRQEFLLQYGHLRPGTYDICSPRYDSQPEWLIGPRPHAVAPVGDAEPFTVPEEVRDGIDALLAQNEIPYTAVSLFDFIRAAIEAREELKFEFTKNLSDALELLAGAGEQLGLSREDMGHLELSALDQAMRLEHPPDVLNHWKVVIERNRQEYFAQGHLALPAVIFDETDFEVVQHFRARPNFITQEVVRGDTVTLNSESEWGGLDLKGKIVLLENADPGYDWIFTKGIAGLLTKYGGVASHMAIRCAEFGLPAAIGCGDVIYETIVEANRILLNCKVGQIQAI
jgi:glutamine kinase